MFGYDAAQRDTLLNAIVPELRFSLLRESVELLKDYCGNLVGLWHHNPIHPLTGPVACRLHRKFISKM